MSSKTSPKKFTFAYLKAAIIANTPSQKSCLQTLAAILCVAIPEIALAQAQAGAGANFFCYIAQYFKAIVGTACLVTIVLWALEHIFGVAKLHDVVIKVGVTAAVVIAGSALITNSGLTTSCVV
ncbi:hypothetical protein CSQ92_10045 [Janthinobacterium sp. BJB446]|nr:hypothetical protein CSQ92_10045 [Janthinobacterium sp. BJB446]